MLFLKIFCLVLLVFCLVEAKQKERKEHKNREQNQHNNKEHKKQKNVKQNDDCSCKNYIKIAKKCKWIDLTCSESTPSESYRNFLSNCKSLNGYRDKKRNGKTHRTFSRRMTCIANLSLETKNKRLASLKTEPTEATGRNLLDVSASKVSTSVAPVTDQDWTEDLNAVKNQGICGSCWAWVCVIWNQRNQVIW